MFGRTVGVGVPAGQRAQGTAAPKKVLNMMELRTFAVQYSDPDGSIHTTVMNQVGGVWHNAPNGENYAATLKPLPPDHWLAKLLNERLANQDTTTIPKEDAVDVLGGG